MSKRTIKEIAECIDGELLGDGEIEIHGVKDVHEAGPGDITFIFHPKLAHLLKETNASCAIVPTQIEKAKNTIIRSENPSIAFKKTVELLTIGEIPHPKGIHKTAVISERASIGNNVGIGPYCVIEDNVIIGDGVKLYPFCYVGHGSRIGPDGIIYSSVSIRERITIGARVIIHSNTVIGGDGFGYENLASGHVKIPQIGDVIIGDDVEIGACVTIDRAKCAHTRIGNGTKIDNLVQIAHNVEIGDNCIIVAQCGISGSCSVGNRVMLAGQVGIADHKEIGDNVMVGAQSGIMNSIPSNTVVWGSPARHVRKQKKIYVLVDKLPEIYERLKNVEKILNSEKK